MKDELNDFIEELDELLENPKYLFASETLSGIKATVEKSSTITAGQRRAVRNIKGVPGGEEDDPSLPSQRTTGGSRRYEGFGK